MISPLNHVCLSGFLLSNVYPDGDLGRAFDLVQHPFHEHFHMNEKDIANAIVIKVRLIGPYTASECPRFLNRGDRVTVHGKLRGWGHNSTVIDGEQVERSEALETLRYHNHPWHPGVRTNDDEIPRSTPGPQLLLNPKELRS